MASQREYLLQWGQLVRQRVYVRTRADSYVVRTWSPMLQTQPLIIMQTCRTDENSLRSIVVHFLSFKARNEDNKIIRALLILLVYSCPLVRLPTDVS